MINGTRKDDFTAQLHRMRILTFGLQMAGIVMISTLLSSHVQAYTCRYRSTAPNGLAGRVIPNGSSANIQVPVQSAAQTNQVDVIDLLSYIECKNDVPQTYYDYMDLKQATTVLSSNFDVKVKARGNEYSVPFQGTASVLNLPKGGGGSFAPIPLQIYYYMKETPGERIAISKGQIIGSIRARHHSNPPGDDSIFTWNFVAANNAIVTSGGCAINDGNPIEINFGVMNQQQLSSTEDKRQVMTYIPYKCRSTSVNTGIKLSLVADQAAFSDALVQTTNANIGIKIMRGNDQLKPYSNTITSTIQQGVGGDNFTFSLLKKANSSPDTGAFTGSATLIMSSN